MTGVGEKEENVMANVFWALKMIQNIVGEVDLERIDSVSIKFFGFLD